MLLCIIKEMDFGVLEWAVLGNVILLLVLLIVLFYTICRLRKATLRNKLEETLPYSDTSDLVPQRYSTLCGLKNSSGAPTRQTAGGVSIFSTNNSADPYHDMRRYEKSNRGIVSNFHLEKNSPSQMSTQGSTMSPIIALAPTPGPPAYISATLPLPGKKATMMKAVPTTVHWTPPQPSYWIALPPHATMAPPAQQFQYLGTPYTTLPAVFRKHQRCRHDQMMIRNSGSSQGHASSNKTNNNANFGNNNGSTINGILHSNSHRLRGIDAGNCLVVHNCGNGKKVQLQEDI